MAATSPILAALATITLSAAAPANSPLSSRFYSITKLNLNLAMYLDPYANPNDPNGVAPEPHWFNNTKCNFPAETPLHFSQNDNQLQDQGLDSHG